MTTPGQKAVQVIPEGPTARGTCRIPSLGGADQILGVLPGQDDLGLCIVGGFYLSTNSGPHGGGQVGQVGKLHGGCGDTPSSFAFSISSLCNLVQRSAQALWASFWPGGFSGWSRRLKRGSLEVYYG